MSVYYLSRKILPRSFRITDANLSTRSSPMNGTYIITVHIAKTCSVFGQIYFSDCEIQHYDRDAREYKPLKVRRGTILVDPDVYFMRNIGSVNNTIIHESVHWEFHRKFFELVKLYNKEARAISCRVQEGTIPGDKWPPFDWME